MGNVAKASVNNFVWIENTSQFNEDFIKNYNEESEEGYFLEVNVQYLKKLDEFYNNLPSLQEKESKLNKSKIL